MTLRVNIVTIFPTFFATPLSLSIPARAAAAGAVTTFVLGAALFGAMLIMPPYFQIVRGENAVTTGLLLIPQGVGAMVVMPIAGRLTDKTGVGRIVPVGLVIVALSFLGLTRLQGDTSYLWIEILLFIQGVGMGATMMPTFSGAMQTLRRRDISRASTTLNIQQQVGASIGTALLATISVAAITDAVTADPTQLQQVGPNPQDVAPSAVAMTEGYTTAFTWAAILLLAGAVVSAVLIKATKEDLPAEGEVVPV